MAGFMLGGPSGDHAEIVHDDDIDDDEDETLTERLWGLTEMFPEKVRRATGWTCSTTLGFARGAFDFSRQALWVVTASASLLAVPFFIEKMQAVMAEAELNQQKELMFGPTAGVHKPGGPYGSRPSNPMAQ